MTAYNSLFIISVLVAKASWSMVLYDTPLI